MRSALLVAGLAVAPTPARTQEPLAFEAAPHQTGPSAPPKVPVSGMAGFRARSRLVPTGADAPVMTLDAYYVFPARVRLDFLQQGAQADRHTLYFRFGEDYWVQRPGAGRSDPLEGIERERVAVRMELRRALLLWPDGFDWSGGGEVRTAPTALQAHVMFVEGPVPVGLVARLDEHGRPREVEAINQADHASLNLDSLREVTWREQSGRWWPLTWTSERAPLAQATRDDHAWQETIESVDTRANLLDHFFLPVELKGDLLPRGFGVASHVSVPASVVLRLPLTEPGTWDDFLARCGRLRLEMAEALREQGLELEPGLVIGLASDARPVACILRLASPPATPPEGWSRVPVREALTTRAWGRGPVTAPGLAELLRALPGDAIAEEPYLRISWVDDGKVACQLVQPFRRER